jgi:Uma2 family endonuclease
MVEAPALSSPRFKFTVKDFYALAQLGLFADHKVELWNGDIVEMSINPPHAKSVSTLATSFVLAFADKAVISNQNPLELGEPDKLPQPDLMLLVPGDYLDETGRDRHPRPHEVLLLVEISDSTLYDDQTRKLKTYASHGVTEYWIADLNHQTWFVYREPKHDAYSFRTTYRFGETFAPLAFPKTSKAWLG